MRIARRLPDLKPYYRLMKSVATAGARSVARWVGVRSPTPSADAQAARLGARTRDAASIGVEQGYVRGWIVDVAGAEGKPLRVFLDGKLIGVTVADVPQPRIGRRFKLDTVRHGFRFPVPPEALDGASHAVAVQTLDKQTRRTLRFVAPPDGEGPGFELTAVSERGVQGVVRHLYDASEAPELWISDEKLSWPTAVTRLTPRDDLATAFEIELLKPEFGALLRRGLRFALPGGHDVGVTTGLVDLLGAHFARIPADALRLTTRVMVPCLDDVVFQIELSADPGFGDVAHLAEVELSTGRAEIALPRALSGQALWARLRLQAGKDRASSEPRHVSADADASRTLYAFDPATAGAPEVRRDPPSGAELGGGVHVQYDASSAETCVVALSASAEGDRTALSCDAADGGAGVRLCFPIPLGTTQAGDGLRLSFALRARPPATARALKLMLMSSRGPTFAKAFEAQLALTAAGPDGWTQQDVAVTLGDCARDDFLDLVMEIEPGAGVDVASVLATVEASGADRGAGHSGVGRKIRVESSPRTAGAAWFDGEAIVGWAVDEADPRRPVVVNVLVDGRHAANAIANGAHPVLIGPAHNDGRCAFRLDAPAALHDGERHVVEVRAADGAALPGSPMSVRLSTPAARGSDRRLTKVPGADHARGGGFMALKPVTTASRERRDVLERETEAPRRRDALFDEQVRRLTADIARSDPVKADALTLAIEANEAEVQRRAMAAPASDGLRVSIVMPTFNRAFLIGEAIQSVVDQSWPNWELIVCDDGSADKTAAVVKSFGDSRIRYLPLEKSNGAVARNFGLRFARGAFIAFLDTDNLWHPEFLRMCVAALSASAAPLCFTSYVDAAIRGARYASGEVKQSRFDYLALLDRNTIDLNAIMIRAEVYETLGGFDERLQRVQDWDLLLRYALVFEPLAIPALGALYRRNPAWAQVTDLAGYTDDQIIVRDKGLAALKAEAEQGGARRPRLAIVLDGSNETDARLFAGLLAEAVEIIIVAAGSPLAAVTADAVIVPHDQSDTTAVDALPPGVPALVLIRDGQTLRLTKPQGDDAGGFVIGRLTAQSAALDGDTDVALEALGLEPSPAKPVIAVVGTAFRAALATALLTRSREGGAGVLVADGAAVAFENGRERSLAVDVATVARATAHCHAVVIAGADPAVTALFVLRAMRDGVPVLAAAPDSALPPDGCALEAPSNPTDALAMADGLASDAYTVSEITKRARQRFDYAYRPSRLRERTVAYLALLRPASPVGEADRAKHVTHGFGAVPARPRTPITAAIKISAPTLAMAQAWGDFHFANALRASLQKLGWVVRVDCRDVWEQGQSDEVTLTLRGRGRYRGRQGAINLLWVISHPDRLTPAETSDFAHVFVASDIFAKILKTRTATPVSVLHQATDPAVFRPSTEPAAMTAPALFVGNSRREYRAMVRWCVEAGVDVHVCGQQWSGLIPDRLIMAEHIGNADLHRWYGGASILLNDHWDTMRTMGFLSNRLFDGSAAGAFIITDPVRGLAPVFGDAIETAADADELKAKVAHYLAHPEEAREKAERARAIVLAGHTFDDRAREIVATFEAARRNAP